VTPAVPGSGGRLLDEGGPLACPPGSSPEALREWLGALVVRYERPAFVADDPVSVPHAFDRPDDQEVVGLFAALLAWGRRSVILAKLADLSERMGHRPAAFVRGFEPGRDAGRLRGFAHRTFNGDDAVAVVLAVQAVLDAYGSLGALFASGLSDDDPDVGPAIQTFSDTLGAIVPEAPVRRKHLARPSTGSACKRVAMYARWMTRPGPVDLGLWAGVRPGQLVVPLDVHTGRQARRLGLLTRPADDWRAVQELTSACRALCPADPVRYDFALFGLGAYGGAPIPGDDGPGGGPEEPGRPG
jgi:uncharacterized protein (TIGR02757 family)